MRQINEAIVHCTATPPNWWAGETSQEKVNEIRRWHVEDRGWRDIGYAYLIDRDGTVVKGRDLDKDGNVDEEVGAHTQGHNANSIGIALFGGHGANENDQFGDHFTPKQEAALRALLKKLKAEYGFTKVSGHNQYAAKACPGFNVPKWLGETVPVTSIKPAPKPISDSGSGRATLRRGSHGAFVLDLQYQLKTLNYFAGAVDGQFGSLTEASVLAFQADRGLTTDGIVGPRTWSALETAGPRKERDIDAAELRARGSSTMDAADKIDVLAIGGTILGTGREIAGAAEEADGFLSTIEVLVTDHWVSLVAIAVIVGAVMVYSAKIKAARVKDARTGAHTGR